MTRPPRLTRRSALRTGAAAAGLLGPGTGGAGAQSDGSPADGACRFQVDLVAGDPIETLGETSDAFYGRQNRLIQYVHGDGTGVTERDTWLNSLDPAVRRCVDASYIRVDVHEGTASVRFRVDSECERTLSLVSYPLPGGEFSFDAEQRLVDAATGTFGPGTHELEVSLPCVDSRPRTGIDEPTTITEPGLYVLTDDVEVTDERVGIQVGAEGVRLEGVELVGNGYTVRGPGFSGDDPSYGRPGTVGMKIGVPFSGSPPRDVVVRDVTVAGFETGVGVSASPTFESATVANNGFGIYAHLGSCTFSRGVIRDNVMGVAIYEAAGHFERNRVVDNGLGFHFSVPTLVGNELVRSSVSTGYGGGEVENNVFRDCGVTAYEASVLVADNLIEGNDGDGIALEWDWGGSIRGNTVRGHAGDGIHLDWSEGNEIDGNTVRANGGDGIELVGSDDNAVVDNVVCGNDGGAIVVSDDSTGNTVRNNTTDC